MYDYPERVSDYIHNNFEPGTPSSYNLKLNTVQFLYLVFQVFPENSITEFQLVEILTDLGYKPFSLLEENEGKKEISGYWLVNALPHI